MMNSPVQSFHLDFLTQLYPYQSNSSSLNIKLLCWILTGPDNHYKKVKIANISSSKILKVQGIHVKNTWGSRCDKLLFMSTEDDEALGAVKLPGAEEGRQVILSSHWLTIPISDWLTILISDWLIHIILISDWFI